MYYCIIENRLFRSDRWINRANCQINASDVLDFPFLIKYAIIQPFPVSTFLQTWLRRDSIFQSFILARDRVIDGWYHTAVLRDSAL